MTDDEFAPYRSGDILPEGLIPTCGIRIVTYLDSEGTEFIEYDTAGKPTIANVLAMFEDVKLRAWCRANGIEIPDDEPQ